MNYYEIELCNNWYFKMKLPWADREIIKYPYMSGYWDWRTQKYKRKIEYDYLYEYTDKEPDVVKFQIGYLPIVYYVYRDKLSKKSIDLITKYNYSDIKIPEFINLYPYQNEDIKQLLKYNRGLFQCFTGYGKTEVIVTLVHYIHENLGGKLLIVTPSNASLNELWYRYKDRYGFEFDYFDYDSDINLINVNGFLRSNQYDPKHEYWQSLRWIIADEVENCLTDTAMEFYENCPNVTNMYGFSATSDKKDASAIFNTEVGLGKNWVEVVGRNKWLVGYFGTSVVYKKPNSFTVSLVNIRSNIIYEEAITNHDGHEYEYSEIIYNLFVYDRVCKLIEKIAMSEQLIYIPMPRLEVIDYWIKNYFKEKDYLIAVICGRGYELYENGKLLDNISLGELKLLVKNGAIRLILGTRSSYNALDLPQLNTCLMLFSKNANVVIQAIGRVSRTKSIKVYSIYSFKTIPIYSRDLNERIKLMYEYYDNSSISSIDIDEDYI